MDTSIDASPAQRASMAGRLRRGLAAFAVAAAALAPAAPALAQNTVPPQLLQNVRPLQGDTLRFCVDDFSPGGAFDRAVSQAVADALLVKAEFKPAPSGFPLDGQGYLDELQLVMTTDCDLLAGISVEPNAGESAYPDWATVSQPYANVPFVLVVKDPGYQNLGSIPLGKTLGAPMGSIGQLVILTYNGQKPKDAQAPRGRHARRHGDLAAAAQPDHQ
jgi:polar amino acid transport system substrate-binding protein